MQFKDSKSLILSGVCMGNDGIAGLVIGITGAFILPVVLLICTAVCLCCVSLIMGAGVLCFNMLPCIPLLFEPVRRCFKHLRDLLSDCSCPSRTNSQPTSEVRHPDPETPSYSVIMTAIAKDPVSSTTSDSEPVTDNLSVPPDDSILESYSSEESELSVTP